MRKKLRASERGEIMDGNYLNAELKLGLPHLSSTVLVNTLAGSFIQLYILSTYREVDSDDLPPPVHAYVGD